MMTDQVRDPQLPKLVLAFDLDAEPEKVWRAISDEGHRDRWLPRDALAEAEVVRVKPGQEVRYRMRDDEPPYLESVVTLRILPNQGGGTCLTVIHELTDRRIGRGLEVGNGNDPPLMLAA